MNTWRDRWHQLQGQTQIVVCRLMIHLSGKAVVPLLGLLNRVAEQVSEAEGDLAIAGEGLVEISQGLLQLENYWQAAANEGDLFWQEGDAEAYFTELFTDSAQRYLSQPDVFDSSQEDLTLPITHNVIVILTIAYTGSEPNLETDLASMGALRTGLTTLINLHYQDRLRAIQIHFSPARLGDELTDEQIILNFPELIPL